MVKRTSFSILLWLLTAAIGSAQPGSTVFNRVELGRLANGATVAFVRAGSGDWGIEISGGTGPSMTQPKPAQVEVFAGDNARQFAVGYQSVQKEADSVLATAKVSGEGQAAFAIEDRWKLSGAVLSLSRKVSVTTAEDNAGFYSAVRLLTAPGVKWEDGTYLIPGLLYGDSSHSGGGVPSSVANYRAKRFSIREDYLSAPLFGISFKDGNWAAVLDPAPRGDTTQAETTATAGTLIVDERIQFGAMGAQEVATGGLELGFWLPGTTTEAGGGRGGGGDRAGAPGTGVRGTRGAAGAGGTDAATGAAPAARGAARGDAAAGAPATAAAPTQSVRRRYHPVKAGFTQNYQIAFRFDKSASFPDMERAAWRWAWASLNPKVQTVDVEVMRTALMDHLADRVLTVDDRFGIPYQANTLNGRSSSTKILMAFCGKNIEAADQFLIEGDRDKTERGQEMRKYGLGIIDSFIRIVPMSPAPGGSGFDIQSGQAITGNMGTMTVRAESEDLPFLLAAYQREKKAGNDHPEWLKWIVADVDWIMAQQRADGSFPQSWQTGTTTPVQAAGAMSGAPVPILVKLSQATGEKKYLDTAIKASEYLWNDYGSKSVYCGATGNAAVADKESGMLALEAFLAAYDGTKDPKWLQRAESAAAYTESWIWIWNVPMPSDADDTRLHWKKGVPTIGVNGIGSDVAGHVDQFLDWAVPCYAELYKITRDEHYLDVARVLLHGTKAMLALPGRTYDMQGPGWQQEHWRMGPGTRGMGAHRDWLPWVSVNHIHGIVGLDLLDKDLYQQLSKAN